MKRKNKSIIIEYCSTIKEANGIIIVKNDPIVITYEEETNDKK